MSRLKLYVLSGLVAVGFVFRAAVPALTQEQDAPEVAQAGAPALASGPAIVVDKNGAEVGPFENIGGTDSVLVTIGGIDFALQVNTKGFVPTGATASYKTGDCTGTAYFLTPTSNYLYLSFAKTANPTTVLEYLNGGVIGTTVYYAKPKSSTSVTVKSELIVNTSGKTKTCYPMPPTKSSVSLVATADLPTSFVEPFKLSF